jgi:O-antigen/teichoic acid export membrane protein
LKKKIIEKLSHHRSLFIIVFGAIGFFLANIILKEKLSGEDYGKYSMVMTFFSMVYIYGLLGLEQVLVKYSHVVRSNTITTNTFLLRLTLGAIVFSTIVSAAFFLMYYSQININPILFLATTFAMTSLLFLYSMYRLNSNFILAQLAQNGFKILFFIFVLALLFFKRFYLNEILLGLSLSIMVIFIAGAINLKKKLHLIFDQSTAQKTIMVAGFYFFISTSTFSIINFSDRYLIEYKLGLEKVGDYFYLSNIFLAPFAILQGYIGFKKLVDYKNSFTIRKFKKSNNRNLLFGILLSIALVAFYELVLFLGITNFDFSKNKNVVLLMLILGTIKLYSAGVYPAFDVVIDIKNLKRAKTIILALSIMILMAAYIFANTVETIILAIIIIWFVKTLILRWFLINQEKGNHFE